MSTPFHETRMGRTVIERDLPQLVESLRQIAAELKALNQHLAQSKETRLDPPEG